MTLSNEETRKKRILKDAEALLDAKAYAKYPTLTEAEIKTLVVEDKWLAALAASVQNELNRISRALSVRVKELAERYETPLPAIEKEVEALDAKVNEHLRKMGFSW